jgi:hypothetical protein
MVLTIALALEALQIRQSMHGQAMRIMLVFPKVPRQAFLPRIPYRPSSSAHALRAQLIRHRRSCRMVFKLRRRLMAMLKLASAIRSGRHQSGTGRPRSLR